MMAMTATTAVAFALAIPAAPQQEAVPRFTITTVAGTGKRGMQGDGGLATVALIERPTAVALDLMGNLYIADEQNRRVRMVDFDGIITTGREVTSASTLLRLGRCLSNRRHISDVLPSCANFKAREGKSRQ